MNFLKNFTKNQIFDKVAEIANIQIKEKIMSKLQSTKQLVSSNNIPISMRQTAKSQQPERQPSHHQVQKFIVQLSQNRKQIVKHQIEKRTKKSTFAQLQIEPIYLQQCNLNQLFKMQLEFSHHGGYQRTQVLHQYLNQVNQTIRKLLFSNIDLEILQVFDIIETNLNKIDNMLSKVRQARNATSKIKQIQSRSLKIAHIMTRKMVIKQKLGLLNKMKQKQQITLLQPQNLQQIYYSERNRHKLYNKIKATPITNSYFNILKNQLISISSNNAQIISHFLYNWINRKQEVREKNIQKLFICLYFVKTEPIYKDNSIQVSFNQIHKHKFIQQIQLVKTWKNYQYIHDPSMKGKIIQFLDLLINQVNSLNHLNQK